MLSPGDVLLLTIDKAAAGGRMLARVNGQVVLVAGAIPGERVTASIERVAKGVAYATTVSVEEPSPDRRAAADPLCGGCLYASIAYPRQLDLKASIVADAFARIARLELPSAVRVAPSPEEGYRMRARLHVRGGRVGFFREGTHDVCDARHTRQLLPATCDVIDWLVAALSPSGLDGVHGIELAENIDASERVLRIDGAARLDTTLIETLLGRAEALTGLVAGDAVHGSAYVTDRLPGAGPETRGRAAALRRHVGVFFQGNRFLLREFVAHIVAQVPASSDVIDLYAGSGLLSIAASAAGAARVTAVEGDRLAAADLAANVEAWGSGVVAVHSPVEAFVDSRSRGGWTSSTGAVRTVIVDPPRTGMSRAAVEGVIRLRAARLVYVSCDAPTLARDARRLADAGYRLGRVEGFDLFPNTPHVETVAVFNL